MSTQHLNKKPQTPTEDIIDIHALLTSYLKKWHWFVVSVILFCALGVCYILCKNPEYQVSSTVMIRTDEPDLGSLPGMDMLQSFGIGGSSRIIESELYILNSQNLMRQVIHDLDIQTQYLKKKNLRYIEQYPSSDVRMVYPPLFTDTMRYHLRFTLTKRASNYKVHFRYGKKIRDTYYLENLSDSLITPVGTFVFSECRPLEVGDKMKISIQSMLSTIEYYRENLQASKIDKESDVLSIATTTDAPTKAIDMINRLVDLYNQDAVLDKQIMVQNTKDFIEERLQSITQELSSIEQDVEKYKKDNQLTDISSEVQLFLASSSEYQKKAAELETQYNLIVYIEDYIKTEENKHNLIPANLGIRDEALIRLIEEYNQSLLERMKLLRATNEKNPVIQQLDNQIAIVRNNIISSIHSLKEGILISRKDVAQKDASFLERIHSVPQQEREYIEIKRQQKIKETLYVFLYQKREENALSLINNILPTKVIDKAECSPLPIAPRKKIVIAICLLLGLCFPIGLLFMVDILQNKINSVSEFKRKMFVPILGTIQQVRKKTSVDIANDYHTVESFRFLRTNINFHTSDKDNSILLVSSCLPNEGKTFVATNLAISYANSGKKVCLVDLNLRNPQLYQFATRPITKDLSNYLTDDQITIDEITYSTTLHHFIDCIVVNNTSRVIEESLLSTQIDQLFAELKTKYDLIIIDSAPLGIVSDTFVLNRLQAITLMISRIGHTPKEYMDYINELHEEKRMHNMFCILNSVDERVFGKKYSKPI